MRRACRCANSTSLGHAQVFNSDVGVHLKFEAKGDANAVDSPSQLFVTVCSSPPYTGAGGSTLYDTLELKWRPFRRMLAVRRT